MSYDNKTLLHVFPCIHLLFSNTAWRRHKDVRLIYSTVSNIYNMRACLYDPTYPESNEAQNDFEGLK